MQTWPIAHRVSTSKFICVFLNFTLHSISFHFICSCNEKCTRTLICGHPCPSNCSVDCPSCMEKCSNSCSHSKCSLRCGEPCVLVMIKFIVYFIESISLEEKINTRFCIIFSAVKSVLGAAIIYDAQNSVTNRAIANYVNTQIAKY